MTDIRASRPKPGLMRQHLAAVKICAEMTNAELYGAELLSSEITFEPKKLSSGHYECRIGSGGSTTLVLQAVLPALAASVRNGGKASTLITGGTYCPMAPVPEFAIETWLPVLKRMGYPVEIRLIRPGFALTGGGSLIVTAEGPWEPVPFVWTEPDPVTAVDPCIVLCRLDESIAERESAVLEKELAGFPSSPIRIDRMNAADGAGNAVILRASGKHTVTVFSKIGAFGVSAEKVARCAARDLALFQSHRVPVESHLADQLLVPLALAGGGVFRTSKPSAHLRSCAAVVSLFAENSVQMNEETAGMWTVTVPAV